jgi:hypothetical protein
VVNGSRTQAPAWALEQVGLLPGQKKDERPSFAPQAQTSETPAWALQQAFAMPTYIGGEGARMAMFPDEYAETEDDRPNILERGLRDIGYGLSSLAPASMSVLGGVTEFLPLGSAADAAGNALAQKGIELDKWLIENVAVENPTLADHIVTGLANTIPFFVTGMGAATAVARTASVLKMTPAAATIFTKLTGASVMSFFEASIEQGQRQQELMGQGLTAGQALEKSAPVFWQNMGTLTATNAAGYFVGMPPAIKNKFLVKAGQAVKAAFTEGGQERAQAVIQDVAAGRGEWADFLDPSKYQTETIVGAVVGGALGGLGPIEGKPGEKPAEGGQKPSTAPLDDDSPAPDGFDVYQEPVEDAQAAPSEAQAPPLVQSPAQMEVPPAEQEPGRSQDAGQKSIREIPPPAPSERAALREMFDAADEALPHSAGRLIRNWVGHEPRGRDNPEWGGDASPQYLAQAIRDGAPEVAEIEAAFGPVRERLRKIYGNTVRLYRYQVPESAIDERLPATSWSLERDFPDYLKREHYFRGGEVLERDVPLDDVLWATDRANQMEFIVRENAPSAPVAEPVPEPVPTPAQPEIAPEAAARDLQAEIRAQTQREEAALRAKYQPKPAAPAPAPVETPAVEPDDDTIGSGVQYHGSPKPIDGPQNYTYSTFNIYGQGLYTSDSSAVVRGYSKRGKSKTATVYRVTPKADAKIYDMDAPVDDALFNQNDMGDFVSAAIEEASNGGTRKPSLTQIMDAMRDLEFDFGFTAHDVQEQMEGITYTLSQMGYDGMTHEGGKFHKGVKPHKVVIYFNPADSVTLTEVKGKIAREAAAESAPPEPAAVAEPAGSPAVPVEAAPAPAPIAAIEREAKKGKKSKAPANYDLLPMPDINTDPKRFQVRSDGSAVGVDEEFVADAVANYDPQAVNPIEVWKDPKDGKFYVIDGHHTREIESRVGKKQAVVKVFKGTEAEAVAASKKRNDQRRGNDIIAQAGVIRDLRATGATKKVIAAEAKSNYRQNAPTVLALSHLNPAGRLMDAMRLFKGASDVAANDLLKIAKWIGEVRGRNPNLTDAHEGEMFDYLRKQMGEASAKNEPEFIRYIEDRIGGLGMFDYTKALNLNNAASRTPAQATYDSELAEAKRAKREADATLKAKNDEFTAAMNREETPNDKPITEEQKIKLLVPYEEAVAAANRVVMNLEARKNEINRSGSSEPGLFKILPSQRKQFSLVADRYKARGITKDMQIAEGEVGPEASLIRQVAQRLGAKVVFFRSAEMKNGRIVGGFYNSASKTIFLNLDAVSREPLLMIAMHELGHHMQHNHPAQWRQMYFVALDNISASAKAAHEAYKASLGYTPDQYAGELMSDIMEEASTRESFWSRLAEEHPTAFANAVAKIKDIVAAIKAVFSSNPQFKLSKHLKSVERMDAAIANAMRIAADRAAAGQQVGPTSQQSMFKVLPPANGKQEMAKRQASLDAAKKRIAAKRRRWTEYPRVVYQRFQDKNTWEWVREKAALKAIGIDIYDYDRSLLPSFQIQRFKGWADKATFALKGAVMSWDNNTVLSESYESIIKRLRLADAIESGEFGQFMIAARRVSDYEEFGDAYFGEPELADGSPNPEYEAAREEFAADEAIYAEYGTPQWIEAAEALTKWSNAMKERGLQGGYLSQEQYDGMVEKHRIYAPMKVLEMEEENASGQSSGPRPTAGRMTWRMDRLIPGLVRQDPMESLVKDAYRLEYLWHNNDAKLGLTDFIKTVHKLTTGKKGNSIPGIGRRVSPKTNPVTRRVADMLKAAGLSDAQQQELVDSGMLDDLEAQAKLWVSSTYMEKNVMAVMRDGEVEYWELDPDIFAIYSNLKGKAAHQMMSFFTMQTKLLRAGVTLTPEFMARNPARDMMNAAILATSLVRTQKIIGPLEVVRPDDVLMLPLRVMRGLAYSIEGRYGDVIPDVARKAMRMQGDPGDLWMRFVMGGAGGGNFVSFDQEGLQKHLDELTRSSRGAGGRAAHTIKNPKYILKSHPLYVLQEFSKLTENSTRLAVLQATHDDLVSKGVSDAEAWARAIQQAREASTDFGRSGEYGRFINMVVPFFNASVQGNDKVIRTLFVDKGNRSAAWARATAMITLPSVLLWALNHDEEWYKEKPAWLKNHCWLFSLDGGKTVIMLPKPFELGMFFGSFPERFLDWAYDHDKKSVGEWANQYVKDIAVADPGSLGGPLVTTAVEVDRNYDAYRGTPIVKGWMQDVIPKEQYTESTTEFAKWLGQSFPGRGLSPLMIDHFVRGATGGVGVYAEKMASAIIMEANPDIKGRKPTPRMAFWKIPEDAPFVKAFVQVAPTKYTADQDELYREFDRSREAVTTMRAYTNGNATREKFEKLYRDRGADLALHESLAKAIEPISMISKQRRMLQSMPPDQMSREERRKRIDELQATENKMIAEYMKQYRQIDRKEIQRKVDESLDRVGDEYDRSKGR